MPSIPVKLTAAPYPYGFSGTTINDLLTLITQQVAGEIDLDNYSSFLIVTVDPPSNQGVILNSVQQLFKIWDNGSGRYLPVGSTSQPGDVKQSLVGGDDPQHGWIVCDGRLLTAVTGISVNQQAVLQALFGTATTAQLPNFTAFGAFSGLPSAGSFSSLAPSAWTPPGGQAASLSFSNPVQAAEAQALAQNVDQANTSGANVTDAVQGVCNQMEALLDAMLSANNASANSPKVYVKLYVGQP